MFSFLADIHLSIVTTIFVASLIAFLLIGHFMLKQTSKLKKLGYGIGKFELVHFSKIKISPKK